MNPAHSTLEILRDAGLSAEQAEQAASAINQAYAGDSNRYGQRLLRVCFIAVAATVLLTAFTAAVIGLVSLAIHATPKTAEFALSVAIGFLGFSCVAKALALACNHKTTSVYSVIPEMCFVFALAAALMMMTLAVAEVDLWRIVVDSVSVGDAAIWMALMFVTFLTLGMVFSD